MGNTEGKGRTKGIAENRLHCCSGHGQPGTGYHRSERLGQTDIPDNGGYLVRGHLTKQAADDIDHGNLGCTQRYGQDQGQQHKKEQ